MFMRERKSFGKEMEEEDILGTKFENFGISEVVDALEF